MTTFSLTVISTVRVSSLDTEMHESLGHILSYKILSYKIHYLQLYLYMCIVVFLDNFLCIEAQKISKDCNFTTTSYVSPLKNLVSVRGKISMVGYQLASTVKAICPLMKLVYF